MILRRVIFSELDWIGLDWAIMLWAVFDMGLCVLCAVCKEEVTVM